MTEEQDPVVLEELRRRLYRAGASGADVQDYLDRHPALPDPGPEPGPPRRPRRAVLLAAVAGAVLLIAALLVQPWPARPGPSVTATAPPVYAAVGDGELLDVADGSVSEPAVVTTSVGGTPVLGRRVEGRGSVVVPLASGGIGTDGGRAVIAVATDGDAPVHWRALLEVDRPDWSTSVFVLARGEAARPGADRAATTFVFAARAPTGVAVDAPRGVRWALVAATTQGLEPLPR